MFKLIIRVFSLTFLKLKGINGSFESSRKFFRQSTTCTRFRFMFTLVIIKLLVVITLNQRERFIEIMKMEQKFKACNLQCAAKVLDVSIQVRHWAIH